MTAWIWLWKAVLVSGVTAFAVLAVAVAIGGWGDIKTLFARLGRPSV